MADADEDVIVATPLRPPNAAAAGDPTSDDEDDAQDYANVAASSALPYDPARLDHVLESLEEITTSSLRSQTEATGGGLIPRRGEKDFEPQPTDAQAALLAKSRAAMHTALSHGRTHMSKTRVLGVYDERIGRVVVRKRKGVWLATTGRDLTGGGVELLPEEALWAVEGGRLDARYRDPDVGVESDWSEQQVEAYEDGLMPMSVQGAYAAFLGGRDAIESGLTMEKYVVYAGLKRAGFVVTRAEGFSEWKKTRRKPLNRDQDDEADEVLPQPPFVLHNPFSWLYWVLVGQAAERAERERRRIGPLLKPGLYSSYQDIFRALELVRAPPPLDTADAKIGIDEDECETVRTPYTTTFNIYQPSQPYKKRNPPQPAFRVCVVSARTTSFPALDELDGLLSEQPPDMNRNPTRDPHEAKKKRNLGQTYAALKRGRVSVLLAVVDEGIVSCIRVNEASFATEGRISEREGYANERGKGGGRGRGRGRGRGGRGRGRG